MKRVITDVSIFADRVYFYRNSILERAFSVPAGRYDYLPRIRRALGRRPYYRNHLVERWSGNNKSEVDE